MCPPGGSGEYLLGDGGCVSEDEGEGDLDGLGSNFSTEANLQVESNMQHDSSPATLSLRKRGKGTSAFRSKLNWRWKA